MRNLTLVGIATAAVLLAAAPAMAQAGIHAGPAAGSLGAGSRYGSFHHVTYRYRHTYASRRYYRYRHTYAYRRYYSHHYHYGYGGDGGYDGGSGVPTLPSWYGHPSYHF